MLYGNREEVLRLIGEKMRARRLMCNLSQQVAAERSGITANTVQNLEKGSGSSLWAFISLCRTYNHSDWVYDLAPVENLDYIVAEQTRQVRKRASKQRRKTDVQAG